MYGNTKGWWSGKLSLTFLRHHFANRPDKDKPLLLLWNDLSAHWTAEVKACSPASTLAGNPQYQLRQPSAAGVKFKLMTPKHKDVTEWVVAAWEGLSREVIQSGFSFIFKPAHPSNAPAATATPLADFQTSTAMANELLALGQLDRVLGEVQEGSDVVENAVAGVFEVLADDEEE
ncbi:hypothetical protein JG688_00017346 [Phytophthora aleatoria]|uniref:DDE-1 domain-containing protein n=1 Tax=Phytophthora aleatoria TaxID=2496075 RepID=A0A8J5ISQ6_9STRA|nr:hypothetical protein JG688_00017346 [Phytophthora aleatoria]